MPASTNEVYGATANPSRKAKRPTAATDPATPIPLQPRKTTGDQDESLEEAPAPVAPAGPAKRGRKPGPLSRAAREAQRRLNHSIIEKARRTKINDALATLKEMVPADYAQSRSPTLNPVDSDGEEDVDEYQPSSSKPKKTGKKPEKEKEFKLEILVRTVAYMKDLVGRVSDLEKAVGDQMVEDTSRMNLQTRKRPRSINEMDEEASSRLHRPRRDSYVSPDEMPRLGEGSSLRSSMASKSMLDGPLPPISSWLPESLANDPRLRSFQPAQSPQEPFPYLPSPPSSTQFGPIRTTYLPPTLSLASMSTSTMGSSTGASSLRTPEDETAANLLIQMSTSPPSHKTVPQTPPPSSSSGSSKYADSVASSSKEQPSKMESNRPPAERRPHWRTTSERFMAQTPASLLGLGHIWMPEH